MMYSPQAHMYQHSLQIPEILRLLRQNEVMKDDFQDSDIFDHLYCSSINWVDTSEK